MILSQKVTEMSRSVSVETFRNILTNSFHLYFPFYVWLRVIYEKTKSKSKRSFSVSYKQKF